MPEPLLLEHYTAPGDITVMSALPRDIHAAAPGQYEIHVQTTCSTLWNDNPHVAGVRPHAAKNPPWIGRRIKLDYSSGINRLDHSRKHFITAFHDNFHRQTGVEVPVTLPHGDLHVSEQERAEKIVEGDYWVIFAGYKNDFTTKYWSPSNWRQLVARLQEAGIQMVQVGSNSREHWNPKLDGVLSLVGPGDLRSLVRLIYHSQGVICPITCGIHMAAAFNKPCVCIAGAREHWWWEAYVNVSPSTFGPAAALVPTPHRYLHTQGSLDCCRNRGCWKNKVTMNEPDKKRSYCLQPVYNKEDHVLPKCLDLLSVDSAVQAVLSYQDPSLRPAPGEVVNGDLPPCTDVRAAPAKNNYTVLGGKPAVAPPPPPPLAAANHKMTPLQVNTDLLPAPGTTNSKHDAVLADPLIGGKMTAFILMYGDYSDMHQQCLNAILSTTEASWLNIRVACNEVSPMTARYLARQLGEGRIAKLYMNAKNDGKYHVMRRIFRDKQAPITTKWTLWFDDDSICNRDPRWMTKLGEQIVKHPDVAMFGALRRHHTNAELREILKKQSWWRDKPLQLTRYGSHAPNGDTIFFCTGGFWAIKTKAIYDADIPSKHLYHNGGDITIGEQINQAGLKMLNWNSNKEFVNTSAVARRGFVEAHPGRTGWVQRAPVEV